jgi:hypothetical protein
MMIFPFILFVIVVVLSAFKIINPYETVLWGFLALALMEIYSEIEEVEEKLEELKRQRK